MSKIEALLSNNVVDALKTEIEACNGAEIFAVLSRNQSDQPYNEVRVVCRGTHAQVPALISRVHPGQMAVHNHPSGILTPSQADMNVATMFGEEGVGSMIINNDASNCYVIVEPSCDEALKAVDQDEIGDVFGTKGRLSAFMKGYETRQGQIDMARRVAVSLNNGDILAAEAGTGTGKSLAYIIPAMFWVKQNRRRVVIATKTIALQEQLLYKDIPLARKILPDAPKASLIKGRNNYVCLRKLRDVTDHQLELFDTPQAALKKEIRDLATWIEESGSGDRADLPFVPTPDAWDAVRSDADMCLGSKCPHFQEAPFYNSRREAAKARILIVNQALLFADLALRSASGNYKSAAVIPPYDAIVLDEAHSMEDIATDHFGSKISSFGMRIGLGKVMSVNGKTGVLPRMHRAARTHRLNDLVQHLEMSVIIPFRSVSESIAHTLDRLSQDLHRELNPEEHRQAVIWLEHHLLDSETMKTARGHAKELMIDLNRIILLLRSIKSYLKKLPERVEQNMQGLIIELDARLQRLEATMTSLKKFAVSKDPNEIPWMILRRYKNKRMEFEYKVSPLDVGPMLKEALFDPFHSVIMTSATLDIKDQFQFFSQRAGLNLVEEKSPDFQQYPSPFDYRNQARLELPRMRSNPTQRDFANELSDFIIHASQSRAGGTLVLFTSYSLLYRVTDLCEPRLARQGISVLVQGRSPRNQLVERLKISQGVLMGTDTFWEGIDLPGDALTKVIITKLPFPQVKDPVLQARSKAIEARGESSFFTMSLPLAMLKFKQGAGRLIRKKDDRGVLYVADRRITDKNYGRRFLALVDDMPQRHADWATRT